MYNLFYSPLFPFPKMALCCRRREVCFSLLSFVDIGAVFTFGMDMGVSGNGGYSHSMLLLHDALRLYDFMIGAPGVSHGWVAPGLQAAVASVCGSWLLRWCADAGTTIGIVCWFGGWPG
jgi:hypothetical protein